MASQKGFRKLVLENLNLSAEQKKILPSGYQRIGHIVILNLRPEILSLAPDMAGLLLKRYKYIRTVCLKEDSVQGELREPRVKWIAGERETTTTHTENGCRFILDVTKVMFSKGNLSERARIPPLVKPGETVADLFAGIGYFSIPIAVHSRARRIYSIELNPTAFRFLKENIRLNKASRITPILGDCRKVLMGDVAERVIMGYLPKTYEYLPAAFEALKPEGGIIHYHDTFSKNELWEKPMDILDTRGFRAGYSLKKIYHKAIVKEFAPNVFHVVVDAEFSGERNR
jgi:tRNA wybutosine-synthesizing protein 2